MYERSVVMKAYVQLLFVNSTHLAIALKMEVEFDLGVFGQFLPMHLRGL